jgi:predicted nucleotidyltransferase
VIETRGEELIVSSVHAALGPRPVILCGSRATGEASADSDYDVFVVVHTANVPVVMRRLRGVAGTLESRLHAPVTLNPLPAFRLRRPGKSLLVWKLRREGKVLAAPPTFELGAAGEPLPSPEAMSSYALSGIRALIADLRPSELEQSPLAGHVQRSVRKATRYAVQLELLRQGDYVSSLDQVCGTEAEDWFSARDRLLEYVVARDDGVTKTVVSNVQFLALASLRGSRPPVRMLGARGGVGASLEQAAVALATAVQANGVVDDALVSAAAQSIPRALWPAGELRWDMLRDVVESNWANANPLVGL